MPKSPAPTSWLPRERLTNSTWLKPITGLATSLAQYVNDQTTLDNGDDLVEADANLSNNAGSGGKRTDLKIKPAGAAGSPSTEQQTAAANQSLEWLWKLQKEKSNAIAEVQRLRKLVEQSMGAATLRIPLVELRLTHLASHRVGNRPNRIEPRAIKRRARAYDWLTQPLTSARAQLMAGCSS
ncbi:MAG: hypothetical protein IAG10_33135 [Planctomycetaceae bacterium]|nr:hypothetical protein [Planctomycetaceae bacterium]